MSALGTLLAHQIRPGARADAISSDRGAPAIHQLRPGARSLPGTPPPYLSEWAHFPVRLNGRACDFTSGASGDDRVPWHSTAQPLTDANGRRYYHPHSIALQWAAGAGSRTITAHVWHDHPSGATPQLRIPARNDLGLSEQIISAGPEIDTDHTLTATLTMPTQAVITVFLENTNPLDPYATSWGDITTT